jgi:ferritin-like metal-binding protein YciE
MAAVGRLFRGAIDVEFDSLHDLFIKELNDLYSAENQLVDALPKMAEAAHSKPLQKAFRSHLKETRGQVARLEKAFKELGVEPGSHKCKAMQGLLAEGGEWMKEDALPGVKDAGLIAAAQRVEHYEMAGYGCVRTYARLLGYRTVAGLLQATLDEEGAADKKLTQLAKLINVRARSHAETSANGKRRAK